MNFVCNVVYAYLCKIGEESLTAVGDHFRS